MDDNYWARVIEPDEIGDVVQTKEEARLEAEIFRAIKLLEDNGYEVTVKAPF